MENKHWKCINFIDQCSFGIYILHMILVRLVLRYWGFNLYEGNIVLNFGGLIIGTLCVTLIVTAVLRKIPGMKKYYNIRKGNGLENVRNVEFSKPFFSILENCGIIHKMYN